MNIIPYTQSLYYINNSLLVQGILPPPKRQPVLTNLVESWNTGMSYLNQNLVEYIYGSSYSYYNPYGTYSVGQRVNGGLPYNNGVYQFMTGSQAGNILTSTIYNSGHGYYVGNLFNVSGGSPLATGTITNVSNPTGWTINITSVSSGTIYVATINTAGTGYSPGDIVTVNGGFSLATLEVTGINGSGGVTSFVIITAGTGYVVSSNVATTIESIYTGNVISYTLTSGGDHYITGNTYSTSIIGGTSGGSGFSVYAATTGGLPPLSATSSWELTNQNFIGVNERGYYYDSKLCMEWFLNRWYDTTFRQPTGVTGSATHSDIYISDNIVNNTPFILAPNSSRLSSYIFPKGSSSYLSASPLWSSSFFSTNWYTVNVPNGLLSTIPNGTSSVAYQVNKLNYYSVPFIIQGY